LFSESQQNIKCLARFPALIHALPGIRMNQNGHHKERRSCLVVSLNCRVKQRLARKSPPHLELRARFGVSSSIMAKKPGRNEPCPCGSGKKYKKCCGLRDPDSLFIPEEDRTGTPFDDYMDVFPFLGLIGQRIRHFEEDGPELNKLLAQFKKRCRPGKEDGITDSFFMSWMHLDLRFGRTLETIAERVLNDPMTARLLEPGPTLIRRLAESYLTFHQIIEPGPEAAVLEELGTGKRFRVFYIRELYETDPIPGEIWFGRLVGPPEEALLYTTPYIYDPETRAQFKRAVRLQEEDFRRRNPLASSFPRERHFAESQKEAASFWAEFIVHGIEVGSQRLDEETIRGLSPGALPFIVNTDREEVVFAELSFRVKDEPALRKRLATLKSFEYDKKNDSWVWLKPQNKKDLAGSRSVLGNFRIKEGCLVAETNSRKRAGRFRTRLKSRLGGLIAYEKTLYRDQDDFPERTPEEIEAQRKETEEFNARPEVQELLRKEKEHYYFKKWPEQPVPALGGLTPVEAAKTEGGRRKLKELLDNYDRWQDADPSLRPRIDFDALRRMLGLPPRVQ